jgi:hypothetical protein
MSCLSATQLSFGRFLLCLIVLVAMLPGRLVAQGFKPGEVIEYKDSSTYPETWERGVIIREIEGGKQYLIRQKPSQFFPEGFERAYSTAKLRPVKAGAAPTPTPPANPPTPAKTPVPPTTTPANNPPAAENAPPPAPQEVPVPAGQGLLTKAQVIGFAKQIFGEGNAFAHPRREALLDQIRDLIKTRGVDFPLDSEFRNQMNAQGTYSVHIGSAVETNYGPPPKLEDYYGTFHLRAANRGSKSEKREGSRVIVTTTDSQHESGALTINPDGTYVWKPFRDEPPAKWLKGKWRVMKPEEMHKWEGGPALWLEKARQGEDYTMRMGRVAGWPGSIEVGMGIGRTPVEYGRRP